MRLLHRIYRPLPVAGGTWVVPQAATSLQQVAWRRRLWSRSEHTVALHVGRGRWGGERLLGGAEERLGLQTWASLQSIWGVLLLGRERKAPGRKETHISKYWSNQSIAYDLWLEIAREILGHVTRFKFRNRPHVYVCDTYRKKFKGNYSLAKRCMLLLMLYTVISMVIIYCAPTVAN